MADEKNPPRPTRKHLRDIAECMKSQTVRTTIKACNGDADAGRKVADLDALAYKMEMAHAKIAHYLPNVKSPIVRDLLTAIIDGPDAITTLERMEKPLKTLAPKKRKA